MNTAQIPDFWGFSLFGGLGLSGVTVLLLIFLALLLSCYVRIVTVLSIVRAGFGVFGFPTAFVTTGLALCLTFFVMYPTLREAGAAMDAVAADRGGPVSDNDRVLAITRALTVWKRFLIKHTTDAERERFARLSIELEGEREKGAAADSAGFVRTLESKQGSWQVLAPAFITSELKIAFGTGLSLLLPFLVIDLLVATVMAALGLETLSAALIALPFKLLLFVIADGWTLITTNLVSSYAV